MFVEAGDVCKSGEWTIRCLLCVGVDDGPLDFVRVNDGPLEVCSVQVMGYLMFL